MGTINNSIWTKGMGQQTKIEIPNETLNGQITQTVSFTAVHSTSKYNTYYEFNEKNHKGEHIALRLELCENPGCKDSIPHLWYKHGHTKTILNTWWHLQAYITNTKGRCYSDYNPMVQPYSGLINFEYILEATEENKNIIIKEFATRAFKNAVALVNVPFKQVDYFKKSALEHGIDILPISTSGNISVFKACGAELSNNEYIDRLEWKCITINR